MDYESVKQQHEERIWQKRYFATSSCDEEKKGMKMLTNGIDHDIEEEEEQQEYNTENCLWLWVDVDEKMLSCSW